MRSLKLAGLVAVAGIVAIALFFGVPLLGSNAAVSHADGQGMGATVNKDFPCGAWYELDGDIVVLTTNDMSIAVDTPSGNMMLSCHFDVPEGKEPAKAMKVTQDDLPGVQCNIPGDPWASTDDWRLVVTPGGKATLSCKLKHD